MDTPEKMLDRISEVCRDFKITSLDSQIESCRSLIGRKGHIDLGVIGRFKAGKSSLLNSLAGADVLPVGVTPVTAVITYLRFAEAGRVLVRFQDGRELEIAPREMPDYICATRNPENVKRAASVEITIPSARELSGLRFVDTPGLGSSLKDNTRTSAAWMPRAEASLVAVSVESPLSEQDISLLRQLVSFTPNITVVLTKADIVSSEQLQEVVAFVTTQLRKEFGRGFPLYPYSTKPGFERMRLAFMDEVIRPLALRHGEEAKLLLRHKLGTLLRSCLDYLKIADATAKKTQLERESLKRKIVDEQLNMDSIRIELRVLARGMTEGTRDRFQKRVDVYHARMAEKVTIELGGRLQESRLNLYRLTRAYSAWAENLFRSEIARISAAERTAFLVPLKEAESTFSRSARGFRDRLASNVQNALGIVLIEPEYKPDIEEPTNPDIDVSYPYLWNIDLLWFLIPMSIFRAIVNRNLLSKIAFEAWKNISRLAFHWTEAINAGIEAIHRYTGDYISREVATIENLLSCQNTDSARAEDALAEMNGLLDGLQGVTDLKS